MDIETALSIAISAHHGQKDKCGDPYILHPLHVMDCVDTEDEKVVAVLHDVVEDTAISLDWLIGKGLNVVQAEALQLLTHEKGVPYKEYIKALSLNKIAKQVKIADLSHNTNPIRVDKAVSNGADREKMNIKLALYYWAEELLVRGTDLSNEEMKGLGWL